MPLDSKLISRLLQEDRISNIRNDIGNEEWTVIYNSIRNTEESGTIFCALIPTDRVKGALKQLSWGIFIDSPRPGCDKFTEDGQEIVRYSHFTQPGRIMPLVIHRTFHGIRPDYLEILEEFRLFHNLYHDVRKNIYVYIHDDGQEEEVIRATNSSVAVKTRRIKQFLSIRELHLAVYFEFVRHSNLPLEAVSMEDRIVEIEEGLLHYIRHISSDDLDPQASTRTYSRLFGKKLIEGMEKTRSGIWPFEEKRRDYVDYIIRIDSNGNPYVYSSNPEQLANYFGANPNAPHYLTPVFFRREVLTKYYSNPEKYAVEDGLIRCGSLWCLRIDNNHAKHIIVYLGDLGHLSYEEQLYWRSYNIPPDGTISQVEYSRGFLAEFTDPMQVDLVFKYCFQSFQDKWQRRFGWLLFKSLSAGDQHLFTALRLPISNDQSEFDGQVLALTKLMVDSLNEQEIARDITNLPEESRGITKLQNFLDKYGFPEPSIAVKFLRSLQSLRSTGVGHRKGKEYEKIALVFQMNEKTLQDVFADILTQAIRFLEDLERYFLSV